jgi:predicted nicotinamide N-methyase
MRRELEQAGELKPAPPRSPCEAELQRLDQRVLHFSDECPKLELQITIEQRPEGGFDQNGGVLWGSGEALAAWLVEQRAWVGELKTAVELGCGPGLVSTVLAKLGVAHVVATDHSEMACALTAQNGRVNGVVAPQLRVQSYEWGEDVDGILRHLSSTGDRPPEQGPQLIVASDVLYEWGPADLQALAHTIRELVRHSGCRLVAVSWLERTFREHALLEELLVDIRGRREVVISHLEGDGQKIQLGLLWVDADQQPS